MTNDNNFKKRIEAIKSVKLTTSEKEQALKSIMSQIDEMKLVESPYLEFFQYLNKKPAYAYVAALVLIALIGGSTSYASEAALPGDILYPVKVDVTEPIEGVFTLGAAAQANWHEELVEKRLQESETLAQNNMLSASNTDSININVQTSIKSFDNDISNLDKTDPVEADQVKINFLTKADIYSKILQKLNSNEKQVSNIQSIRNNLNQAIENTFLVSLEGDSTNTPIVSERVNYNTESKGDYYKPANNIGNIEKTQITTDEYSAKSPIVSTTTNLNASTSTFNAASSSLQMSNTNIQSNVSAGISGTASNSSSVTNSPILSTPLGNSSPGAVTSQLRLQQT